MPIFEYKCVECGRISEFLKAHGSRQPKVCPQCGNGKLEKQISTFALGVKGGNSKRCGACDDQSCPHSGH